MNDLSRILRGTKEEELVLFLHHHHPSIPSLGEIREQFGEHADGYRARLIDLGLVAEPRRAVSETRLSAQGEQLAEAILKSRTAGPDRWDRVQRAIIEKLHSSPSSPATQSRRWEVESVDGIPVQPEEIRHAVERLAEWGCVKVSYGDDQIYAVVPTSLALEARSAPGLLSEHFSRHVTQALGEGPTVGNKFEINASAIRRMTEELQKEFDKNPVRIPIEANPDDMTFPSAVTNNYHGPVVTVHGDNAQLAWGNETATQTQNQAIAPGYEDLAKVVTSLLAALPELDLPDDDELEAQAAAESVLGEVVKDEPDQSRIKRGVTMLKGLLAPVATGVGAAVTAESADLTKTLIEQLGSSLPF